MMHIDVVNVGWAPFAVLNLTEDVPGYIEAPAKRFGTRGHISSPVISGSSARATT